ncbi:hypothetical protein LTS18_006478, partial [Coniosporium uncinatum]
SRIVAALYDHFLRQIHQPDGSPSKIDPSRVEVTIRTPVLPDTINYTIHDVASTFKRLLSELPGGLLGSVALFEALEEQTVPTSVEERDQRVNAKLVALALLKIDCTFRLSVVLSVFGLLAYLKRDSPEPSPAATPSRPPEHDGMSARALSIVFAPVLLSDLTDQIGLDGQKQDEEQRPKSRRSAVEKRRISTTDQSRIKRTVSNLTELIRLHHISTISYRQSQSSLHLPKFDDKACNKHRRSSSLVNGVERNKRSGIIIECLIDNWPDIVAHLRQVIKPAFGYLTAASRKPSRHRLSSWDSGELVEGVLKERRSRPMTATITSEHNTPDHPPRGRSVTRSRHRSQDTSIDSDFGASISPNVPEQRLIPPSYPLSPETPCPPPQADKLSGKNLKADSAYGTPSVSRSGSPFDQPPDIVVTPMRSASKRTSSRGEDRPGTPRHVPNSARSSLRGSSKAQQSMTQSRSRVHSEARNRSYSGKENAPQHYTRRTSSTDNHTASYRQHPPEAPPPVPPLPALDFLNNPAPTAAVAPSNHPLTTLFVPPHRPKTPPAYRHPSPSYLPSAPPLPRQHSQTSVLLETRTSSSPYRHHPSAQHPHILIPTLFSAFEDRGPTTHHSNGQQTKVSTLYAELERARQELEVWKSEVGFWRRRAERAERAVVVMRGAGLGGGVAMGR